MNNKLAYVCTKDMRSYMYECMSHAFCSWWFDPMIATLGFMISIYVYTLAELHSGTSSYKSFREFLLSKGSGIDTRWSLSSSLIVYWTGILIWIQIVPPPKGEMPLGIPNSFLSLLHLMTEVLTGIIQYDAYFFFIHWALHECSFLRFILHKEHHKASKNLEARHVLRHSFFDGALQVLVNIAVQRYTIFGTVKSRLARALHNIIVTWMLTESHTPSPYPNVFRKYCIAVREHRKHHLCDGDQQYGKFHRYQQFFGYLDDLRANLAIRYDVCKKGTREKDA